MGEIIFPDPRSSTEEGIVALGGNLEPQTLLRAYRQGIFPWPMNELPLVWFCPPERAILEFKDFHVSRSLKKLSRKSPYRFSVNQDFESVIQHCANVPRPGNVPGEENTWITQDIVAGYLRLHKQGYAHSVEAWEGSELAGGLYGVGIDGNFAAESMFHLKPNASKLALDYLVEQLLAQGLDWLDIQVMTPHMEKMGARLIDRDDFLQRLLKTKNEGKKFFTSG